MKDYTDYNEFLKLYEIKKEVKHFKAKQNKSKHINILFLTFVIVFFAVAISKIIFASPEGCFLISLSLLIFFVIGYAFLFEIDFSKKHSKSRS